MKGKHHLLHLLELFFRCKSCEGFLFLLHCCRIKNLALVIDNNRRSQIALCSKLKIKTISIEEFNKEVIKNNGDQ